MAKSTIFIVGAAALALIVFAEFIFMSFSGIFARLHASNSRIIEADTIVVRNLTVLSSIVDGHEQQPSGIVDEHVQQLVGGYAPNMVGDPQLNSKPRVFEIANFHCKGIPLTDFSDGDMQKVRQTYSLRSSPFAVSRVGALVPFFSSQHNLQYENILVAKNLCFAHVSSTDGPSPYLFMANDEFDALLTLKRSQWTNASRVIEEMPYLRTRPELAELALVYLQRQAPSTPAVLLLATLVTTYENRANHIHLLGLWARPLRAAPAHLVVAKRPALYMQHAPYNHNYGHAVEGLLMAARALARAGVLGAQIDVLLAANGFGNSDWPPEFVLQRYQHLNALASVGFAFDFPGGSSSWCARALEAAVEQNAFGAPFPTPVNDTPVCYPTVVLNVGRARAHWTKGTEKEETLAACEWLRRSSHWLASPSPLFQNATAVDYTRYAYGHRTFLPVFRDSTTAKNRRMTDETREFIDAVGRALDADGCIRYNGYVVTSGKQTYAEQLRPFTDAFIVVTAHGSQESNMIAMPSFSHVLEVKTRMEPFGVLVWFLELYAPACNIKLQHVESNQTPENVRISVNRSDLCTNVFEIVSPMCELGAKSQFAQRCPKFKD